MPYAQEIKEFAYTLDPEAWQSYSGKSVRCKQNLDERRKDTLNRSWACFIGLPKRVGDALLYSGWVKSRNQEKTMGNTLDAGGDAVFMVKVCFRHDLRPELGLRHNPNKQYTYLTRRTDIVKGDTVVVKSPTTEYTCVEVVDVVAVKGNTAGYKWVVDRVDDTDYLEHQAELRRRAEEHAERQRKIRELANSAKQLESALEQRVEAQMRELARSTVLLNDPEAQALVNTLNAVKTQLAELLA